MSDGNTMIDNVMAGHELGQDVDYDEEYIIAEDHAMVQAEEKMMKQEEGTSEDDESLERHILTTALVKSVVETSKKKPDEEASADDVQRYSLRKRRRPTGEDLEKLEEAQTAKRKAAQHAPENPSSETTRNVPPTAAPDPARNTNTSVPTAHAQLKTEAVPAVTVAAPASFTAPIPSASSLPPALQPPPRQTLSPKPSATSIGSRAKSPAKSKQQQRLAPAARIPAPKAPLEPDTAICGVPNPLSSPFPMSTGATTATNAATNGQSSHQTFKAGARLTVPCPLPASTFEKSVKQSKSQKPQTKVANATTVPAPAPELEKKKTVTISTDLPVQSRGRIFSIDLDPASLDFSVLDPDPENGVTAPASADLPLLSGGPRDRAYSFECFAFGINADEPLPDYGEQSGDANDEGNYSGAHGRQRGDSIIFDPASFQEGGIHEEHALTTRERRGISIDLDSIVSSMPVPSSAPSAAPASEATATASSNYNASTPSQVLSSARAPSAAPPIQPKQTATNHSASYTTAGAQGSNRPQNGYQHPYPNAGATPSYSPSHVPSNVNGSNGFLSGAVAATSQTFQMELLNKDGRIGIYLPEARRERIARFHAKRKMRIWRKRIKYDCRKKLADSRPRIKGRFVKRSDMDD